MSFASINVECERLEAKWAANGGSTLEELEVFQRASNSLRRLVQALGLQRRAKDVTPSLDQYLNHLRKNNDDENEAEEHVAEAAAP